MSSSDRTQGYTSRRSLCDEGFRDEHLVDLFGEPTSIEGVDYWATNHVEQIERAVIAPAVRVAYCVDAERLYGDGTGSWEALRKGAEKFIASPVGSSTRD